MQTENPGFYSEIRVPNFISVRKSQGGTLGLAQVNQVGGSILLPLRALARWFWIPPSSSAGGAAQFSLTGKAWAGLEVAAGEPSRYRWPAGLVVVTCLVRRRRAVSRPEVGTSRLGASGSASAAGSGMELPHRSSPSASAWRCPRGRCCGSAP